MMESGSGLYLDKFSSIVIRDSIPAILDKCEK